MRLLDLRIVLICLALLLAACTIPATAGPPYNSPIRPSPSQPRYSSITTLPTAQPRPTLNLFEREFHLTQFLEGIPFGVLGSYAFVVDKGYLGIYDLSDLEAPVRIWQSGRLGEDVLGITALNNKAYTVADGVLEIWDTTDLSFLKILGTLEVKEQLVITISNTRLYLIQLEGEKWGLSVVDISRPTSPQELGEATLELASPHRLIVIGNHLYCLYDGRVDLFDISNPSVAVLRRSLSLPTDIKSQVAEKGNFAFIGAHSGVWVLDISDFTKPIQVGHYLNLPVDHIGIVGQKGYLISSICEGEVAEDGQVSYGCGHVIDVVDFSRPEMPDSIGYVRLHLAETDYGYIEEARFLDRYVFLKSNTGFWYVLDLNWLNP